MKVTELRKILKEEYGSLIDEYHVSTILLMPDDFFSIKEEMTGNYSKEKEEKFFLDLRIMVNHEQIPIGCANRHLSPGHINLIIGERRIRQHKKPDYQPIEIDATELGASLLTKEEQVTYFKLKFKIASEMLKRQHLKALKEDE